MSRLILGKNSGDILLVWYSAVQMGREGGESIVVSYGRWHTLFYLLVHELRS